MNIVLYDWAPSPFCIKVRAILDYKLLPYRRINALNHVGLLRKRGGIGKAPAVDIDGEMIVDSTDIVHDLERRVPEPSVLPASPRDRALCHALEDWTDESLYFTGLYYHWFEPAGREQVRGLFNRTLLGRVAYYRLLPRILRQLTGQGTLRKTPEHVRQDLDRHIEAIEALLANRRFLLADRPYLCDFALMSQLVYLQRSPVGHAAIGERESIRTFLDSMRELRAAKAKPVT